MKMKGNEGYFCKFSFFLSRSYVEKLSNKFEGGLKDLPTSKKVKVPIFNLLLYKIRSNREDSGDIIC